MRRWFLNLDFYKEEANELKIAIFKDDYALLFMKLLPILIFLLILNTFILAGFLVHPTGKVVQDVKIEYANLTNVVDGDTIDTNLGRVRLLGINTPEKKHAGYEEAKSFLEQFIGKEIILEKTIDDKDKYGRLLRYVFFQDKFLNKEILSKGLAHFYSYNEDKYSQKLKSAEEKARNLNLGIWEKSKEICSSCIILVKLNEIDPGEFVLFKNKCNFNCDLTGWTINDDSSSHEKKLNFIIPQHSQYQLNYTGSIWNDAGDSLYLRDASGLMVIFFRYP